MKNIVLCAFILISSFSYGQIGEVENVEETTMIGYNRKMKPRIELNRVEDDSKAKKTHILSYQNWEYQQIEDLRSLSFSANEEELEQLFNMFYDLVNNDGEKTFKLGDVRVLATGKRRVLTVYAFGEGEADSFFKLNKNQLLRLFGKK